MAMQDTIAVVKKLLALAKASGLDEVCIEIEGIKLEVRRKGPPAAGPLPSVIQQPSPPPVAPYPEKHHLSQGPSFPHAEDVARDTIPTNVPTQEAEASPSPTSAEGKVIKAPMIGTFYVSSSPEAAPFVKVGDTIAVGQTLCIIEAMKLFNEIEAEEAGVITEILTENGTPVEYNQPLFRINPAT